MKCRYDHYLKAVNYLYRYSYTCGDKNLAMLEKAQEQISVMITIERGRGCPESEDIREDKPITTQDIERAFEYVSNSLSAVEARHETMKKYERNIGTPKHPKRIACRREKLTPISETLELGSSVKRRLADCLCKLKRVEQAETESHDAA